jgi:hypothetical protein
MNDSSESDQFKWSAEAWRKEQPKSGVMKPHETEQNLIQLMSKPVGYRLIRGFNLLKGIR